MQEMSRKGRINLKERQFMALRCQWFTLAEIPTLTVPVSPTVTMDEGD
jgi:hypothetical protein